MVRVAAERYAKGETMAELTEVLWRQRADDLAGVAWRALQ
jgi:hypothetical protein